MSIIRTPVAGGWYCDATIEGDKVVLFRDSHIEVNGVRVELPPGQSNLLQLVATRWRGQVLIAGQGQSSNNWLYKDGNWIDLGPSFATFACAFDFGYLYYVVGPNQYRSIDLETLEKSPITPRVIGANGIRYISIEQSPDGIVTGDSTYGPSPYNISQWTKRDDIVCGQSYINGCIALYFGKFRLIEPGDTQFIRFKKQGNKICIAIVKMLELQSVFYWMDATDLDLFPIQTGKEPEQIPGPINTGEKLAQKEILKKVRSKYPTPLGQKHAQLLLESALALGNGAGLLRKAGGTFITLPDGITVAQDIICYPDGSIFDFLIDGEGKAEVSWNLAEGSPVDTTRYYKVSSAGNTEPEPKPTEPEPKPEPEVIIKEVIKEVEVNRPRVRYEEMMQFVARMSDKFADTKLGKDMSAMPEHTAAHILWRYLFEHDTYSDDKLLEEVKLRGNGEWRD